MNVCAHIFIYVGVCVCVYLHIYVCGYIHICMGIYGVYIYKHIHILQTYVCISIYIYISPHIYMYIYIESYVCVYIIINCVVSLISTMTWRPQQPFDSGAKEKSELITEDKKAMFKPTLIPSPLF